MPRKFVKPSRIAVRLQRRFRQRRRRNLNVVPARRERDVRSAEASRQTFIPLRLLTTWPLAIALEVMPVNPAIARERAIEAVARVVERPALA